VLTEAGQIAADCWRLIQARHPAVGRDLWVVMPDHFHGLIRPAATPVSGAGPGRIQAIRAQPWRPGILGVLINQFKRAVTLEVKRRELPWTGWQPRCYDRIIRNERALRAIRHYIAMNPARYIAAHARPSDSRPIPSGRAYVPGRG
jgi:REP element-mobilizing transposase RayT